MQGEARAGGFSGTSCACCVTLAIDSDSRSSRCGAVFRVPRYSSLVSLSALPQTTAGIKNLSAEDAARLESTDPDYATRDLFEHIQSGKEAVWDVSAQFM